MLRLYIRQFQSRDWVDMFSGGKSGRYTGLYSGFNPATGLICSPAAELERRITAAQELVFQSRDWVDMFSG